MSYSKDHSARRKATNNPTTTWKPKKRTCKSCKNKFEQVRQNQIACSPSCAYKYAKALSEKKKIAAQRAEKRRIRDEKEKNKSASELKADLQKIINEIVRIIDKDYPCIARPGEATLRFDAGHFYSVKSMGSLRFHLDNIHKQSSQSNGIRGGDETAYANGLELRYGKQYLDYVRSLKAKYPVLQPREHDLRQWIATAKEVRKRVKKGEQMTRDQINKELNIYK